MIRERDSLLIIAEMRQIRFCCLLLKNILSKNDVDVHLKDQIPFK